MDFKLWKKQPQAREAPAGKPALEVFCPRLRDATFGQMQKAVEGVMLLAEKRADKSGDGAPAVVLFSEAALGYQFNVEPYDSAKHIGRMRKIMGKHSNGRWMSFAFNVREDYGLEDARNTGYFVLPGFEMSYHKRRMTFGEMELVDSVFLPAIEAKWAARMKEGANTAYPTAKTPSGLEIEYRICADACSPPFGDKPDAVSILSSEGNHDAHVRLGVAYGRRLVLENDAYHGVSVYHAGDGQDFECREITPDVALFTLFQGASPRF